MAQSPPPASPFKVMAVNVNGLATRSKRRMFFASLQKQRQAVVLLSETHCTTEQQGLDWVQEGAGPGRPWQGAAFFAPQADQGGRAAGGVGVLIAQHLIDASEDPVVEYAPTSGRVLKVSWLTPWGQRLAAVAIYAPCTPHQRAAFFTGEYLQAITSGTQQQQIVGGDFNCVMRQEDILSASPSQAASSSRLVGGRELQVANFLGDLQDAWLARDPNRSPQPTHYIRQPNNFSAGRIDYVFLPQDMIDQGWMLDAQQHRSFPSDHRPVVVRLQPPGAPKPGKKRWRFPLHMLGMEAFR